MKTIALFFACFSVNSTTEVASCLLNKLLEQAWLHDIKVGKEKSSWINTVEIYKKFTSNFLFNESLLSSCSNDDAERFIDDLLVHSSNGLEFTLLCSSLLNNFKLMDDLLCLFIEVILASKTGFALIAKIIIIASHNRFKNQLITITEILLPTLNADVKSFLCFIGLIEAEKFSIICVYSIFNRELGKILQHTDSLLPSKNATRQLSVSMMIRICRNNLADNGELTGSLLHNMLIASVTSNRLDTVQELFKIMPAREIFSRSIGLWLAVELGFTDMMKTIINSEEICYTIPLLVKLIAVYLCGVSIFCEKEIMTALINACTKCNWNDFVTDSSRWQFNFILHTFVKYKKGNSFAKQNLQKRSILMLQICKPHFDRLDNCAYDMLIKDLLKSCESVFDVALQSAIFSNTDIMENVINGSKRMNIPLKNVLFLKLSLSVFNYKKLII